MNTHLHVNCADAVRSCQLVHMRLCHSYDTEKFWAAASQTHQPLLSEDSSRCTTGNLHTGVTSLYLKSTYSMITYLTIVYRTAFRSILCTFTAANRTGYLAGHSHHHHRQTAPLAALPGDTGSPLGVRTGPRGPGGVPGRSAPWPPRTPCWPCRGTDLSARWQQRTRPQVLQQEHVCV